MGRRAQNVIMNWPVKPWPLVGDSIMCKVIIIYTSVSTPFFPPTRLLTPRYPLTSSNCLFNLYKPNTSLFQTQKLVPRRFSLDGFDCIYILIYRNQEIMMCVISVRFYLILAIWGSKAFPSSATNPSVNLHVSFITEGSVINI
jgi:hypothetical protein